jgi:outer membrane protein, adhesin transport system
MQKNIKKWCAFILILWLPALSAQSLKDAVKQAMNTNPEILQNQMDTLATKQEVNVAKGAFYPRVEITSGFGREQTESPITQDLAGTNKNTLNRIELNATMTQNIFSGGSLEGEFERNKHSFFSKNYKTIGTANDIALEVTEAYLNVILQKEIINISKVNYKKHKDLLGLIEQRANAGIAREAELNQALARVNLAKVNLINAEGNYQEARIKFKKVVGTWPTKLELPTPPNNKQFPNTPKKAIEAGLSFHPLMLAATADIREAQSQQKVATATFFPKVDAVLSASRNRNLDGLSGKNFDNLAAIRASYTPFKGGSDVADAKRTAFLVKQAYEVRNTTIIDIKETIGLSYNAWETTTGKEKELKKYVVNVQKTKNAYFEQFKIGKRSLLDLLNSQNEEYRAKVDYRQAQNEEILARYRILNGIGTLLPYLDEHCKLNACWNKKHNMA